MKIYAGSDHAGWKLRTRLVEHLRNKGHEVVDFGTNSDASVDYPDYANKVAQAVRSDGGSRGLLVCGSGIGICIAANKVRGIRAVDAWSLESATLSRAHNDTNVLCVGERTRMADDPFAIVDTWLTVPFEGGRHLQRIQKIAAIEAQEGGTYAVATELAEITRQDLVARLWRKDAFLAPATIFDGVEDTLHKVSALTGATLDAVTARASTMAERCAPAMPGVTNPAVQLAAFLTAHTKLGRDKITLLMPAELPGAGALLANVARELSGGRLHVDVHTEETKTTSYGADRALVALQVTGGQPAQPAAVMDALRAAGVPLLEIELADRAAVGGQVVMWTLAAALARILL